MIRYWLPVRLLAYDVPHRITGRAVIAVMSASHDYVAGEYRRKPRRHSARDVLLIVGGMLAMVAIAAEVRWALGAR